MPQLTCTFLATFLSPSCHFLASHLQDTFDTYLKYLPHSTADILSPAPPTITVGNSTYQGGVLVPFRPFFGQPTGGLRWSPPPPHSPSSPLLNTTGDNTRHAIVSVFRCWAHLPVFVFAYLHSCLPSPRPCFPLHVCVHVHQSRPIQLPGLTNRVQPNPTQPVEST